MNKQERVMRTFEHKQVDRPPLKIDVTKAAHQSYADKINAFVPKYPNDFTGLSIKILDIDRTENRKQTDAWGCVWQGVAGGHIGYVVQSPLDDLCALGRYKPPAVKQVCDFDNVIRLDNEQDKKFVLAPGGWL